MSSLQTGQSARDRLAVHHRLKGQPVQQTPNQLWARGLHKSYFKGTRPTGSRLLDRVRWPAWAARRRRNAQAIEIPVLLGVDLEVHAGEFLSIVGASGSGKSTLLHLLGTLDSPDQGQIHTSWGRIDNLDSRTKDRVRNELFGFIFQLYHLLPELNTLENVLLPLMIRYGVLSYWRHQKRLRSEVEALLDRVGLADRIRHKPNELSGGELQRAAIARALAGEPQILLADEPTGNLDQATGRQILELLSSLNRQDGLTIIMVTHDRALARMADLCLELVGGKLQPV